MRHFLPVLVLLLTPPAVSAQPPTLPSPANLGAKPGAAGELTLTGTGLRDISAVWLSVPATVTIPMGQTDPTKLRLRVELPADAAVGTHLVRVATAAGVSNPRPFAVDDLPEVAETDANRTPDKPQLVPGSCVVAGRADADAADFFRVPVKAGVAVTFEVVARRLGSPLDPVIVLRGTDGKELPGRYADDTPGLQGDARLTHTPAADCDVVVEVRDSTYRGGPDFAYRLRIGNFPGATTAFPLAVERGKTAEVGFAGPDAAGAVAVRVTAPADPLVPAVNVAPKRAAGVSGWPVPVRISDTPELVEAEPNDTPATATKLPVPGGVSAKFAGKNDRDHFAFPGKKGQKLVVRVLTFEVNSPAEVFVRVLDSKGTEVAKSDPTKPGTRVEFTPAADGEFVAACEHQNYLSGPTEVYHLSVRPAAPDFAVTLGAARVDVPAGAGGALTVTGVSRLNGFAGPIDLAVVGPAGLGGTLTVTAAANPTPAAPLTLTVTATAATKPGAYAVRVRATAKIDGADAVRPAEFADVLRVTFAGLPNPPAEFAGLVGVGVTQARAADPKKLAETAVAGAAAVAGAGPKKK